MTQTMPSNTVPTRTPTLWHQQCLPTPTTCAQVTVNYWLLQHGMSIGIADTVADEVTMTVINEIIEKVGGGAGCRGGEGCERRIDGAQAPQVCMHMRARGPWAEGRPVMPPLFQRGCEEMGQRALTAPSAPTSTDSSSRCPPPRAAHLRAISCVPPAPHTPHHSTQPPTKSQAKEEVKKIIATYQSSELEQQPGRTIQESFENRVNAVLNKARDDAGKRAQNSLDLSVSVGAHTGRLWMSAGPGGQFMTAWARCSQGPWRCGQARTACWTSGPELGFLGGYASVVFIGIRGLLAWGQCLLGAPP